MIILYMKDNLLLPISIVVAGLIIGAGFYFSRTPGTPLATPQGPNNPEQIQKQADLMASMREIDRNDHVLGDSDARIVLVEYSDPECAFCKMFHSTMLSLMDEYGKAGQLSWVYRHFPITEIHPNAFRKAEAMECIAALGDENKFWQFTNLMYERSAEDGSLALTELPKIAKEVGVDEAKMRVCMESGEMTARVEMDVNNAREMGFTGTPQSILIDRKTGDTYPIQGAFPYFQMKQAIDLILES